jgi:hypothetical protein
MPFVNARAIHIRKKDLGKDNLADKIIKDENSPEAQLYAQAKRLNESPLKKQYVESALLTCDDLNIVSDLLEIPLPVITMYRDVYYEVTGLDKLSKMELLDCRDKNEGLMKLWALSQGLSFIAWRLGKQVNISPVEGLQDLFTTCMYKAKEAMFNSNVSEASKESTKWVKLSLDIARLLKLWVLDSAAARADIELALQEVVPEFQGLDSLDKLSNDEIVKDSKKEKINISLDESLEINTSISLSDLNNDESE